MKLSKASTALAYLISGSAPTIVVTAATTGASGTTTTTSKTTKLRGRTLQGDGSPSTIVHEDDNIGDCTVVAQDNLMIPKEGQRNLQYGDNHLEFVCEFEDGSIASMEVSDEQKTELEAAMNKGQIVSGNAKIDTAKAGATKHGNKVHFPKGLNIAGNAASGRAGNANPKSNSGRAGNANPKSNGAGNANPKSKAAEATTRRRKLAQLVGNKYTLVVKGRFLDYPFDGKSASQISDDVFGAPDDDVNLKSQLEACSFGKLVTVAGPDPAWNGGAFTSLTDIQAAPGVLEIDMGVNMAGMSKIDIFNLFKSKTIEALGPAVTALPGPFDHVLFSRETCLTECGWAAYAGVNSWYEMYQGNYISYPGVLIHEMGHNLNLAHSGSPGDVAWSGGTVSSGGYTDHTCSMGNPLYSDEIGRMCFNPAKSYQIDGWYNDAKLVLDPLNDLPFEGDVVGVGEYDKRGANEPVTIKIETNTPQDYFVGFNRAAGPNSQNDLADDQVNVIKVEGNDGEGYSQSQLVSLLNGAGYAEYAIPGLAYQGQDFKVKVNSINTGSPYGKANMRIGYDECVNDAFCQSTAGSCFSATCQGQGVAGTNVFGCSNDPSPDCCGNEMCEVGEDATSCADDCLTPEMSIQPGNCNSCWIKDGAMFDVEAKPDADITITQLNYKAYTSTGNMRVYIRPGGKAGYASGSTLTDNGWVFVKQQATCGSTWTMCPITDLAISVPRGTKVGILVAYDNGGDVLYYNTNYGPTSDEHLIVHEGTGVNYNLAGDYANSFHNALMFSGDVIYKADLTPPAPACLSNGECQDGSFCNGQEACINGSCVAGTPPACANFCSEALGACVDCLSNNDCGDGVACTVDFCTPATGLCTSSPDDLECNNGSFCAPETCDVVAGCQPASNPCTGATPFCDEVLDQCKEAPTPLPTNAPVTPSPTNPPTNQPITPAPTKQPTPQPVTPQPTNQPTPSPETASPSKTPTDEPTPPPTPAPTTSSPTDQPTDSPVTQAPTNPEITPEPSQSPVTSSPTDQPTDSPVTLSPTDSPTKAPTNTQSSYHYTNCGASHKIGAPGCGGVAEAAAEDKELHEVRCCADTNLGTGWIQPYSCKSAFPNTWGESQINGICYPNKNFIQASNLCSGVGARLCTKEELAADCTRGTGCSYDNEQIWSSTPVEFCTSDDSCEDDGLACTTHTCGLDGICTTSFLADCAKMVVCGSSTNGACNVNPSLPSDPEEAHEVRCCSDTDLGSPWKQHANCPFNVWAESPEIGDPAVCQAAKTYDQANQICSDVGARLCTEQELLNDCARGTGCSFDKEYNWSSTPYTG